MSNRLVTIAVFVGLLGAGSAFGAEDVTYTRQVRQIIDSRCTACHGSGNPEYPAFKKEKEKWVAQEKGPRMDTYAHLIYYTAWPDTGAFMRRLDDGKGSKDGKAGNMYQHLGASDEERQKNLAIIKAWVGNWVLKKWPEITKEEMNGITVKY